MTSTIQPLDLLQLSDGTTLTALSNEFRFEPNCVEIKTLQRGFLVLWLCNSHLASGHNRSTLTAFVHELPYTAVHVASVVRDGKEVEINW